MSVFSAYTLETLLNAGWSETRDVDPTPWITELKAQGYTVVEPAVAFMRCFGGITGKTYHVILFPKQYDDPYSHFSFNPVEVIDYEEGHRYMETLVGSELTPIGFSDDYMVYYTMDRKGEVYMRVEADYYWLATTGEEAVEEIVMCNMNEKKFLGEMPEEIFSDG